MNIKHTVLTATLIMACSLPALAQERGAEALRKSRTAPPPPPSSVEKETSKLSYSMRSRGFLRNPRTGERQYEIVTLRERGFWGNGCLTQLLLGADGQLLAVLNSSASAGPGIAMVQGASFVGGMYLFAEHLRPPKQNINSNNANSGNSGVSGQFSANSSAGANAEGGAANNNVTGGLGTQNVNVNSGNANGNGVISLGGNAQP